MDPPQNLSFTPQQSFCVGGTVLLNVDDATTDTLAEKFDLVHFTIDGITCPIILPNPVISGSTIFQIEVPSIPTLGCRDLVVTKITTDTTNGSIHKYSDSTTICIGADSAMIDYGQHTFCITDANPLPQILQTTDPNGIFVSTSSLIVNDSTGEILMYNGAIGMGQTLEYQTTDLHCPDTFRISLDILAPSTSHATLFNSNLVTVCNQDTIMVDTANLVPKGGRFLCQQPGLIILDDSAGMFDLSQSTPGYYTIQYIPSVICFDTATIVLHLEIPPVIDYGLSSGDHLCKNVDPVIPIFQSGPGGGIFISSPVGLDLNASSGEINPVLSDTGWYQISYIRSGNCIDTVLVLDSVEIKGVTSAFFDLGTSFVCSEVDTLHFDSVTHSGGITTIFQGSSQIYRQVVNGVPTHLLTPNQTYGVQYTSPSTSACPDSTMVFLTVGETQSAVVIYVYGSNDTVCSNSSPLLPVFTMGQSGGVFTADSPLLSINSQGVITPALTTPGTYTLLYTPPGACGRTDTVFKNLTFQATINASFSLPVPSVCGLDSNIAINPVFPGGVLNVYQGSTLLTGDTSLTVPVAGILTPGQVYTLSYSTDNLGYCGDTQTQILAVETPASADIDYNLSLGDTFCTNHPTLLANFISGTTNGDFLSFPPGVFFGPNGDIEANNSSPGWYDIRYVPPGNCRDTVHIVDSIYLSLPASAYFTLISPQVCETADTLELDSVTTLGGYLEAIYGGNSMWGGISNGVPVQGMLPPNQTYALQYTTSNHICPDTSVEYLNVLEEDTGQVSYGLPLSALVCQSESYLVPAFQNGQAGGAFYSFPTGLNYDSSGVIFPSQSAPGAYIFYYMPPGACPRADTLLDSLTIRAVDTASFSLPTASVCAYDSSVTLGSIVSPGGIVSVFEAGNLHQASTNTTIEIQNNLVGGQIYDIQYDTRNGLCPDTLSIPLEVLVEDTASITYGLAPPYIVCKSVDSLVATFENGQVGGTFFSVPAGLQFSSSGTILPGATQVNSSGLDTFSVYYIPLGPCPRVVTILDTLIIAPVDSVSFGLNSSSVCLSTPFVTLQSPTPANGQLTLFKGLFEELDTTATSFPVHNFLEPGTYIVEYTSASSLCPHSQAINITIAPQDTAIFSYPNSIFCTNDSGIDPINTITSGGVYSSPTAKFEGGNDTTSLTGFVNFDSSGTGYHWITYTTLGPCPDTHSVQIQILSPQEPDFDYEGSSPYCTGGDTLKFDFISSRDGYFVVDTLGLVWANQDSGWVNLVLSSPGTYRITHKIDGSCGGSYDQTITIKERDTLGWINYPDSIYCKGVTTPPAAIGPDTDLNGVFEISPAVGINSETGEINLIDATRGLYYITFNIENECAEDPVDTIDVEIVPGFGFSYPGAPFCESEKVLTPEIEAVNIPGIYSTSSPLLPIDSINGKVDLSGVPAETYMVYFQSEGHCYSIDSTPITIHPNPEGLKINATPGDGICQGEMLNLELSHDSIGAFWFYFEGTEVLDRNWYDIEGLEDGDFIEGWFRNQYGCEDSVTYRVSVHPPPALYGLSAERIVIGEEPFVIHPVSTLDSTEVFWWEFENGQALDSGSVMLSETDKEGQLEVNPVKGNPYNPTPMQLVLLPSVGKCAGEPDTLQLLVLPEPGSILVPEIFTPNGDGVNDSWLITWGMEVDPCAYEVEAFNRQGRRVYYSECLKSNWTADGLPDGVYKWLLRSREGFVHRTGMVTIRRK